MAENTPETECCGADGTGRFCPTCGHEARLVPTPAPAVTADPLDTLDRYHCVSGLRDGKAWEYREAQPFDDCDENDMVLLEEVRESLTLERQQHADALAALRAERDAAIAMRDAIAAAKAPASADQLGSLEMENAVLRAERDRLKAALEAIAHGGPLTGQRTGPMKMYQAQAVAKAALTSHTQESTP